jgi:LysM repeat protein
MLLEQNPTACPFVALDSDRDRRAEAPDSRHRCYAEPVPAPRALSHQKAFCLSADFPGCPIFKDWAVRAAASPMPANPGRQAEPEQIELLPAAGVAAAAGGFEPEPAMPEPEPVLAEPEPVAAEQEPGIVDEPAPSFLASRLGDDPSAGRAEGAADDPAEAPVPAFLAARSDQPRPPVAPPPPPVEPIASVAGEPTIEHRPVERDEIVPSWERDPHFATSRDNRLASLLSRATTLLLVLALLALAAMAVVLAPGLIPAGGGQSQPAGAVSPTPATGQSPGQSGPAEQSPAASVVPSIEPSGGPIGDSYTIKSGDNLCNVSKALGLSYQQLVGANPQITNPNKIKVGQVLTVPSSDFTPPTPAPGATPIVSPCG